MNLTRRFRHGALILCLCAGATPALSRTTTQAPGPSHGKLGQDLFLAINRGDAAGVQSLLKRGADPNATNGLDFTPLFIAAATGQMPVVEALLKAGAKLDAPSPYGTPLTFAAMTGCTPAVKLLLARGANIKASRADGISVLMMAARAGDPEIVGELLRRKADVNAKDNDGATPLSFAAREGHEAVGRVLLDAGAAVDAADSRGWTPLMYAAVNGHEGFCKLLLEKGAHANAREAKGRTALLLAASYGDHPAVVSALLKGGADPRAAAGQQTAQSLAAAHGYAECARLLSEGATAPALAAVTPQRSPKEAAQVSLKALQRSMVEFTQRTGCVSCHHEGLGRMATGTARERGFAIDPALTRAQLERLNGAVNAMRPMHAQALKDPAAMKNVTLIEIGEVPPSYTFMLAGMAAEKQPANEATGAMAMVLARQQSPNGAWQFSLPRVPMQSSFFTTTALAVRSLRAYAPRAQAAEIAGRIGRAKAWLLTEPAKISEDRAFRLLGLQWAGASKEERQKAIEEVRADQRPDGGWSQLPTLQSDAYATGQALYALCVGGGLATTDPVYQRGMQFLLRTQEEDGSWFVNKRALPVNNYFDAAFPHGQSQYSSFNATCWATMALVQTVDRTVPVARRAAR